MTDTTSTRPQMGDEEILNAIKLRLREHWLTGIHCDHERKTDRASCSCSVWRGEEKPSIAAAVQDWVEHAMSVFASLPQPTAQSTGDVAGLDLDAIEARANAATPGPWGIESCGEKGDGSNMIGVLFDADVDTNCERPILGWAAQYRPVTEEFIEYYRDELVAECDHRNRKSGADAEFIAYARTDIPALIAEVRALRASTPAQSVLVAADKRFITEVLLDRARTAKLHASDSLLASHRAVEEHFADECERLARALSHALSQPAPVVAGLVEDALKALEVAEIALANSLPISHEQKPPLPIIRKTMGKLRKSIAALASPSTQLKGR